MRYRTVILAGPAHTYRHSRMACPDNGELKILENRMHWLNRGDRYGTPSIALHWLTLLVLVAVYACAELRDSFPKGSEARAALATWHFMLGLSVLCLATIRLAFHIAGRTPESQAVLPRWQQQLAATVQYALYALMIGLPLAGWMLLSAQGKPVPFFGLHLPALSLENRGLAKTVKEIHEVGATTGYFLIALHATAALYHHYIVHDDTLRRMLPQRG